MAALAPAQTWGQLRPGAELYARVKAYVPASPHFRDHHERWRVRTQSRTDAAVRRYLVDAAQWLDASAFPTHDTVNVPGSREEIWFNAACIKIFEYERGYELREIELHLINWRSDVYVDLDTWRENRIEYATGRTYLEIKTKDDDWNFSPACHDALLYHMIDIASIDVNYVCRALRRARAPLIMTTLSRTTRTVWILETKRDEDDAAGENPSEVCFGTVVDHAVTQYDVLDEEESYVQERAEEEDGTLVVHNYGSVDLRSSGPNGALIDDMIAGITQSDVAATVYGNVPTAPRLTQDVAGLVAQFSVFHIHRDSVFPHPPTPAHEMRKHARQ